MNYEQLCMPLNLYMEKNIQNTQNVIRSQKLLCVGSQPSFFIHLRQTLFPPDHSIWDSGPAETKQSGGWIIASKREAKGEDYSY